MKGVADIFISKEKLALFWFMVACGSRRLWRGVRL